MASQLHIWELPAGPNTQILPLGTIFLCTQALQAGYPLRSFQAKPRCLVAVDEKWRRQWRESFGRTSLPRRSLNHAALMPPISGELLGESVGRVRTSRQDDRESEMAKGGNVLTCNQPWRKEKKPHQFAYFRILGTSFTKSESEIQLTQWCRCASCRNSCHPEQRLACKQNIQLVDACSRWSENLESVPPLQSLGQHPRPNMFCLRC